jgi:hypothetical protein
MVKRNRYIERALRNLCASASLRLSFCAPDQNTCTVSQRRGVRDRDGLSHRRFEKGRDAAGWLANSCEEFVSEGYDRARAIALGALTAPRPLPNLQGVPLWDDRDSLSNASMPGATSALIDDELALDASFVQSDELIR